MALKIDAKFERKLTCTYKNDMKNLANLHQSILKVWELGLWWDPFIQSRKRTSLKFTGELCVMTIKSDAKFEVELTFQFKIDMRKFWHE